ncbi:CoA transferase [Streptomyces nymphaeiformis]|uniref:Crotonobetainyl-CoA:carnitine CoA-transferase CaiB-like acyl-CoA transferase n=1 Tax=Streptomyces nymphaeiformis TaxID=2663842 RepID=A0A7W7TW54_9ACTN|nr:CoA transferase [Streptomyces nymphaeiformis]MBB4980469.1 crotonobetainyl-CoA:carnitine CoA-transferase CaiB-like acyl-CoA transferase [Streptomyces nymphaeiformis]
MASPAITHTEVRRPLDALRCDIAGPPALSRVVADHLRRLGARPGDGDVDSEGIALGGDGFAGVTARTAWGVPGSGIEDEATAQAATGVMTVHGRRHGAPRGLGVDYLATATGVLTVQGLLAGLIGQARGGPASHVTTSADRTGLLTVSQYLAAAGADEPEAVELSAGGPPFSSADGVLFELETLDPGAWAAFWRALNAPADAIRAGWRPFQFRYATACAPFPVDLHEVTRLHVWARIRQAAGLSGAEVCRLRTLGERAAEDDGADPWTLTALGPGAVAAAAGAPMSGRPLSGLTVLEAGRRIQAPLAAHLLGLLGARVIRIEPPGGDPLRGMPPACDGISARWLALNRGKEAVEIDIKSSADRRRLRELAAEADVFLHNWAPGKAGELELDAEHLAAVNPALVYAYTGGWADRIADAPMGTDFMVQARTGVGEAVHPAGEPPVPSLMTLLDLLGGLHGTEAILAGLLLRERTGHGVRVDSSLLGAADTLLAPALHWVRQGLDPRPPAGFRHPLRTSDGWIAPSDASAAAAAAHDVRGMCTEDALDQLRSHGLTATAVTTDLSALHHDPRLSGSISRDAHGAPAVPDPWSFA